MGWMGAVGGSRCAGVKIIKREGVFFMDILDKVKESEERKKVKAEDLKCPDCKKPMCDKSFFIENKLLRRAMCIDCKVTIKF